ncbi:MAG: ATP-dependent metallopeptidase FtsH/Yme1/Tma family protein, partial [Actinomycetota bacterium]|nr:ATP-dependent metallopeptidase FtsH/Yme1/Tma family protein [Actinomycetota bacterium]
MSNLPPPPPPPPPGRAGGRGPQNDQQPGDRGRRPMGGAWPRWVIPVLFAVLMLSFALPRVWPTTSTEKQSFSDFLQLVEDGKVKTFTINNQTNSITGELANGEKFTSTAPNNFPNEAQSAELEAKGVDFEAKTPSSNWLLSWASLLLPLVLLIGFFMWMQRRAAGQMGNVMSIGRSRAKAYTTDKPSTTFADIAGYEGVKQEITEVVDFLRMPERFREIGAR